MIHMFRLMKLVSMFSNSLVVDLGNIIKGIHVIDMFSFVRNITKGSVMKVNHAMVVGLVLGLLGTTSDAQEHVITQENNKFSEVFMKLGHNDKIKIVNRDTVNHKISFHYKDKEQLVAELKPGMSQTIELRSPGIYDIKSHVHPEMKLTVYVPHSVKMGNKRSEYYF